MLVFRLPKDISEEVDEDPTGTKLTFERGYLNGAPHKVLFQFAQEATVIN